MKPDYSIGEILSPELIGIISVRWGEQLWAQIKVRKSTSKSCVICKLPFQNLKSKLAFRPLTNAGNRMERICINCMELAVGRMAKT